jgi:hypothetical protein
VRSARGLPPSFCSEYPQGDHRIARRALLPQSFAHLHIVDRIVAGNRYHSIRHYRVTPAIQDGCHDPSCRYTARPTVAASISRLGWEPWRSPRNYLRSSSRKRHSQACESARGSCIRAIQRCAIRPDKLGPNDNNVIADFCQHVRGRVNPYRHGIYPWGLLRPWPKPRWPSAAAACILREVVGRPFAIIKM